MRDDSSYEVKAQLDAPKFAVERRYIMLETKLASGEMNKRPRWLPFSYPELGILRRSDWHKYIHELERYGRELDRCEREIQEGLMPLVFMVYNDHSSPDMSVRVRLTVEGGHLRPKHKSPVRPRRVDGAPNQSNLPKLQRFPGFARRNIHITTHAVEAEFSRLEAHDSARLVNETLYVDTRHGARLHFEIVSQGNANVLRGEVKLPARQAS